MKKAVTLFSIFFTQSSFGASIDEAVESIVGPITKALSSAVFFEINFFGQAMPLIVLWLVTAGLFFTIYLGFINIRGFGHAIRVARGDYKEPDADEKYHISKQYLLQFLGQLALAI